MQYKHANTTGTNVAKKKSPRTKSAMAVELQKGQELPLRKEDGISFQLGE